jgi:hypothetical protein
MRRFLPVRVYLMAKSFDRILVQPKAEELEQTIQDAVNGLQPLLPNWPNFPFSWPLFLSRIGGQSEGRYQWTIDRHFGREPGLVSLTWWSDFIGRRHFRVSSGENDWPAFTEESRPPLGYIYPSFAYLRNCGNTREWLVACGCGAAGRPADLAWMGSCCGPCHDRLQEGLNPGGPPFPPLNFPSAVQALAFSPKGPDVAVACRGARVFVADERGIRAVAGQTENAGNIWALAWSPDGRFLAFEHRENNSVWILEPKHPLQPPRLLPIASSDGSIHFLAFRPDGASLAILRHDEGLELWNRDEAGVWTMGQSLWDVTSAAYSTRDNALALGNRDGTVTLRDRMGVERDRVRLATIDEDEILFLSFIAEDRALVYLNGNTRGVLGWPAQLGWWRLGTKKPSIACEIPQPSAAALSPDGKFLAIVIHDEQHSPGAVSFWEVATGHHAGTLEWDLHAMLFCLAFHPDGELLAAGADDGIVKLLPWRALLEA